MINKLVLTTCRPAYTQGISLAAKYGYCVFFAFTLKFRSIKQLIEKVTYTRMFDIKQGNSLVMHCVLTVVVCFWHRSYKNFYRGRWNQTKWEGFARYFYWPFQVRAITIAYTCNSAYMHDSKPAKGVRHLYYSVYVQLYIIILTVTICKFCALLISDDRCSDESEPYKQWTT